MPDRDGSLPHPPDAPDATAPAEVLPDGAITEEEGSPFGDRGNIVKQLLPWVITGGILYFIFRQMDIAKVTAAIERADLVAFGVPAVVFVLLFIVFDVGSVYCMFNWFNTRLKLLEVITMKAGSNVFGAILPPLGGASVIFYMTVRRKQRLLEVMVSGFFFGFMDATLNNLMFLIGGVFMEWEYAFVIFTFGCIWYLGILPVHLLYWFKNLDFGIPRRFRRSVWVRAFRMARPREYAIMAFWRFGILAANVVMTYYALRGFGIDIPFAELAVGLPIILGTAFTPISVGGMGLPQLLWMEFYGGYATQEDIIAFSLLWSTTFLVVRLLTGALFFKRYWSWLTTKGQRGPGGEWVEPDVELHQPPAVLTDPDAMLT